MLTISKSFYMAIDNKDKEVFRLLNSFLYERMSNCFEADNITLYKEFSALFVYYYEYALLKLNSSIAYRDIYDYCADRAARGIKEKFGWILKPFNDETEDPIDTKKRLNNYSKILLNRFADLINVCIRNKDLGNLRFILNQLQQCADSYNRHLSTLKWEIANAKKKAQDENSAKELATLEEKYEVERFTNLRVRLLFKVTLFWSFFLYHNNVLSSDELKQIIKEFKGYRSYIENEMLSDLLFLNSFSTGQFSWENWDYMKRLEGVVYSPPMVHHWVTFGACIYSLLYNVNINLDFEEITSKQINDAESIISSMSDLSKELRRSGFERWGSIFNKSTKESFDLMLQLFQNHLSGIEKKTIIAKSSRIADSIIDKEYSENFKNLMYEGWKNANIVNELFSYFKSDTLVLSEGKDFLQVGVKDQLALGYKTSVIKDNDLNIQLFGLERRGQQLADLEEAIFVNSILLKEKSVRPENVLQEMDRAIDHLTSKGFSPSIIMIDFFALETIFRNDQSANYQFDYSKQNRSELSTFGGTYKNIPVIRLRSDLMSNRIVIADFNQSFKLERKTNDTAFQGVLNVNIGAIDRSEAEAILEKNPHFKEPEQSSEDAEIMLMNALKIDFYLEEKFSILNELAYEVFKIET